MAEQQRISERPPQTVPVGRFMAAALERHAGLAGQDSEQFCKIVADLTAALQQGHICIDLDPVEQELIRRSAVVGEERQAPLVLSKGRLYFGRYFRYEADLAAALGRLAVQCDEAGKQPEDGEHPGRRLLADPDQEKAIDIATSRGLCIISGGPGTGKTTIIVSIISLLLARHGPDLKIGLAAPTGKAAMRMQESIRLQLKEFNAEGSLISSFPTRAATLHRLLGLSRFSKKPKHDAANPMVYDVVLVDEASMIDLALMSRLVGGLKKGARLILIGDRDQLASVESGAVLADCIDNLPENVVELNKSYRFNERIAAFAETVKSGDGEAAWSICSGAGPGDVRLAGDNWLEAGAEKYQHYMIKAVAAADPQHYRTLFKQFNSFRILCALRKGQRGSEEINSRIELLLARRGLIDSGKLWYPGRPIIISRNDHSLGLFNGDIGICLPDPESGDGLRVWFDTGDTGLRNYLPGQIPAHETAWALTIHKSQGSEFEETLIVLPENDNQILCRELMYTAITRARKKIRLVLSEDICTIAVSRNTVRQSGLGERLASARQRPGV